MHLECPAWVNKEVEPLDPSVHLYIRPFYEAQKTQQLYIICKNKYRKAAKMRRQRTMDRMKTEWNSPPTHTKTKLNGPKKSTRCRVQNTDYKDAQ